MNASYHDKVTGKEIKTKEKVCDNRKVKEHLFCEKELDILIEIKNRVSFDGCLVDEFLNMVVEKLEY